MSLSVGSSFSFFSTDTSAQILKENILSSYGRENGELETCLESAFNLALTQERGDFFDEIFITLSDDREHVFEEKQKHFKKIAGIYSKYSIWTDSVKMALTERPAAFLALVTGLSHEQFETLTKPFLGFIETYDGEVSHTDFFADKPISLESLTALFDVLTELDVSEEEEVVIAHKLFRHCSSILQEGLKEYWEGNIEELSSIVEVVLFLEKEALSSLVEYYEEREIDWGTTYLRVLKYVPSVEDKIAVTRKFFLNLELSPSNMVAFISELVRLKKHSPYYLPIVIAQASDLFPFFDIFSLQFLFYKMAPLPSEEEERLITYYTPELIERLTPLMSFLLPDSHNSMLSWVDFIQQIGALSIEGDVREYQANVKDYKESIENISPFIISLVSRIEPYRSILPIIAIFFNEEQLSHLLAGVPPESVLEVIATFSTYLMNNQKAIIFNSLTNVQKGPVVVAGEECLREVLMEIQGVQRDSEKKLDRLKEGCRDVSSIKSSPIKYRSKYQRRLSSLEIGLNKVLTNSRLIQAHLSVIGLKSIEPALARFLLEQIDRIIYELFEMPESTSQHIEEMKFILGEGYLKEDVEEEGLSFAYLNLLTTKNCSYLGVDSAAKFSMYGLVFDSDYHLLGVEPDKHQAFKQAEEVLLRALRNVFELTIPLEVLQSPVDRIRRIDGEVNGVIAEFWTYEPGATVVLKNRRVVNFLQRLPSDEKRRYIEEFYYKLIEHQDILQISIEELEEVNIVPEATQEVTTWNALLFLLRKCSLYQSMTQYIQQVDIKESWDFFNSKGCETLEKVARTYCSKPNDLYNLKDIVKRLLKKRKRVKIGSL